jgi:hypothetical protein
VPATARVDIARATLRRELTGDRGLVTRYVRRQVRAIRNRAVLLTPVDTGNLRASITYAVSSPVGGGGWVIEGRVGTGVEYAYTVHEGHPPMSVTVPAHGVRAHTIKAHRVKAHTRRAYTVPAKNGRKAYTVPATEIPARTVAARTRLASTRRQHWRTLPGRAGRPFLRRAMEEVLARG